jgi:hypothetical protein
LAVRESPVNWLSPSVEPTPTLSFTGDQAPWDKFVFTEEPTIPYPQRAEVGPVGTG